MVGHIKDYFLASKRNEINQYAWIWKYLLIRYGARGQVMGNMFNIMITENKTTIYEYACFKSHVYTYIYRCINVGKIVWKAVH
jgi:hypothetical protein